jgi:hypothetical protein
MTAELLSAFDSFDLPAPVKQPDGSYQWGTWRIERFAFGSYGVIDDASPADANSPWPLRMNVCFDADEVAAWLADEGPDALTADGYAALQARADALCVARGEAARKALEAAR